MRRRRLLFRGGIAVLLMAALLATAQSSQADDEPDWYPGLPNSTFGQYASTSQGSMAYAKRAKQWFISPTGMVTAEYITENAPEDAGNGPDETSHVLVPAEGYFVSPKGAPANYGYLEAMTVRSVGFGMIPVEATVQVSQRRANGLPIPVRVVLDGNNVMYVDGGRRVKDYTVKETKVSDSFNVQILDVKVDGVDLELNGDCRTVEPAPVSMVGPGYVILDYDRTANYGEQDWYLEHDISTYYNPIKGGELTGTMTIPPFTGCTTKAGDDLSRLMTLSVSGPDNPVKARTGYPCPFEVDGRNAPAPPGASNPQLGDAHIPSPLLDPGYCPGIKPFEYPARADR